MEVLLAHGADLNARTRIDDYATPLKEMERLGNEQSATFIRIYRPTNLWKHRAPPVRSSRYARV